MTPSRLPLALACSVPMLACAHRGDSTPGVVVTMTRLTVTPTPENNPGARWDEGKADSRGDEGCGLLVALDFVAAGLGTVAATVCSLSASGDSGGQWKAEDPDLFVRFELGRTTYASPVISDRASHDLEYSLFIPRAALRDNDLELGIYDRDGDEARDATLVADLQLGRGQLDRTLELRGSELDEPSLKLLRLEFHDPPPTQDASRTMDANDGLVAIDELEIPAGMQLEIRASGKYEIGSWNDAKIGPTGYPGGGPKDYNLPGREFRKAAHGAAVALLQQDGAAQAIVVGECTRFIARSGGRLYVGVNDSDFGNNRGELSFAIRVTTPDADAWARGAQQPCGD